MTPKEILAYPARILSEEQRIQYFEKGYVCVEGFADFEDLKRIQDVTNKFVEKSKAVSHSDEVFDIAPGHTAAEPKLRRLKKPDQQHQTYWDYTCGPLADVAADLLGPDVVFHHSKLNFKWRDESDQVKWHQDAQFFPHTNYNVITIGMYLADTNMENGPLSVIPGSHNGPLYDQYDDNDKWVGHLNSKDLGAVNADEIVNLTGKAGSITVHNCRMLHGSPSSQSDMPRPLFLNCFTSADARPYTPNPQASTHAYEIVRGAPARWAHHDPRPCLIPPDWSEGYASIYAAQAGEK